jgi:hypothetical protein
MDHLFTSVHFPVLPRQLPPLLERSQVMAWSVRFEPVRILFQAKAGYQNLADFDQLVRAIKELSKGKVGGASGI